MSQRPPPGRAGEEQSCASTRAQKLCIPEHALSALEYQARRHYRRWRLDEAERIAEQVIRFDAGRPGAWLVLGDIEMRRFNWGRAFGHFRQSVDCHRGDPMSWCRGAEALLYLGAVGRAEEWFQYAASLAPPEGSPGARRARLFLAEHADEFRRARQSQAPPRAEQPQLDQSQLDQSQPDQPQVSKPSARPAATVKLRVAPSVSVSKQAPQ